MAKTQTKAAPPAEVAVTYDLFDLPTAFHKAGLAGLVLLLDSLRQREVLADGEGRCEMTPTRVTLTFTERLVQKLMDDVYDAAVGEVRVKSKWPGAEPKREETVEEEVNGKLTNTKRYIYDQVQPRGRYFDPFFDGEMEIWRKLWRDMLWAVPRGKPLTRIPYNERAEGKPCGRGPAAWGDLLKALKARAKGSFHTAELSSALLPGSQEVNAEGVPFEGRVEQNFLLHFWTLTTLIFVPCEVEKDGTTNLPPSSYTLAVPEVGDLEEFVPLYRLMLERLEPTLHGYRPRGAVIDIAAEGGLAFLDRLAAVADQKVGETQLSTCLRGVEYLHLVKPKGGRDIKTMAAGRVSPTLSLIANYRAIVCPAPGQPRYLNPLFRRGLLLALLDGDEWYRRFADMFATFDAEVFVRQPRKSADPEKQGQPQFAGDAARKLRHETQIFTAYLERMTDVPEAERPKTAAPLAVIVNRVVRGYLLARAAEKSGVKLDAFEADEKIDWKSVPPEFNEAKQKLAIGLMYEVRSRRDQALVEHFATTFLSVTQRLGEADRLALAAALTTDDQRDDLKTLTLLSLSANS